MFRWRSLFYRPLPVFRSKVNALNLEQLEDRVTPSSLFVDPTNMTGIEDGSMDNPFNTIQEAIDAAVDGNTIHLASGDYLEDVVVDKQLTLSGANEGIDPQWVRGVETILTGNISVLESNVTINGLTLLNGSKVTSFQETFEVPDGSDIPDSLTVNSGTFGIQDGALVSMADDSQATVSSTTFSDFSVEADVALNGTGSAALLGRVVDSDNYYVAGIENDGTTVRAYIAANNNGVLTDLVRRAIVPSSGKLRFELSGDRLRLFLNETRLATAFDDTIASGAVGLEADDGVTIDNLVVREEGEAGLYFGANTNGLSVLNNIFTGEQDSAAIYSTSITENQDITVQNNDVSGWMTGIDLQNASGVNLFENYLHDNVVGIETQDVTTATVSGNLIEYHTGPGIFLGSNTTGIQINQNNFFGNVTGLEQTTPENVDAENNFWGSSSGPMISLNGGQGDFILEANAGSIDFIPFLTNPSLPFQDGFTNESKFAEIYNGELGSFAFEDEQVAGTVDSQNIAILSDDVVTDVIVQAQLSPAVDGSAGIVARYSAGGLNTYWAGIVRDGATTRAELWKRVNGAWSLLDGADIANESSTVRLTIIGDRLELLVDGNFITFVRDSSLAQGNSGFWLGNDSTLDDFLVSTDVTTNVTQGVVDDFNVGNGAKPQPFYLPESGNFVIEDGQLLARGAGSNIVDVVGVSASDAAVEARLDQQNTGSVGMLLRYSSGQNWYWAGIINDTDAGTTTAEIWARVNGVDSQLATIPINDQSGLWRFEAIGTTLSLLRDDAFVLGTTNDLLTAPGSVALSASNSGTIDDFLTEDPVRVIPDLTFSDSFAQIGGSQLSNQNYEVDAGQFVIFNEAALAQNSVNNLAVLRDFNEADTRVVADTTQNATGSVGLIARYADLFNYYWGGIVNNEGVFTAEIWRNVNGNFLQLGQENIAEPTGMLEFEVAGDNLALTLDDVELLVATDSLLTTGTVGFSGRAGATIDDFSVNDAFTPQLDPISNRVIAEDSGELVITLTGIDAGAATAGDITLTATSSDLNLIPDPTITYISPETTGTLSFTPVTNANGAATITVTVDNGLQTFDQTFEVSVTAVNDAPTVDTIADITIDEDAGEQTLDLTGLTAGGADESETLSVSATSSDPNLIPDPTVTYTSPNTTGTLSFTPVENANGAATITVAVNDGSAITTEDFVVTVNAINDAPTIAAIPDLGLNENAGQQTINLTGITPGGDDESDTLTVTAVSSDTNFIPDPTITYTSPNTTGTLTFTPAANTKGSVTITVTVDDGDLMTTEDFVVNVNEAPTIDPVPNQTINEDTGEQMVDLTGITSGAPDELDTLIVTATSSDPDLIPDPTVTYTSPNTTGTLAYTPVADANGTATITVTVDDGVRTTSEDFVVTVNAINDDPMIDPIPDLTIDEDPGQQTVNLTGITAGPPDESATLVVTAVSSDTALIPDPTVTYTSPNTTGTLTFTPVADANGAATITVTVDDGLLTTTEDFVVTVNAINDAPTITAIPDSVIDENAGLQSIDLMGITSGAADEVDTLVVTAVSSDPDLLPDPTVTYSSPDTTGTLTFTPAADSKGAATITVTVDDGMLTTTEDFVVTINEAPTIDGLSDLTIDEDAGEQTVDLTGVTSGANDEADTLVITATSSDPNLIPDPTVAYTTPDTTGTLSFTPLANANGAATITVTVDDGFRTTTDDFVVTVNAINDAPTITSLNDRTVNEDVAQQTINLTGITSGAANESDTLMVTATSSDPNLIPDPTLTYTSPDTTGTLSFAPLADANGVATITVTVDDGGTTTTEDFVVTVNAINDPPTLDALADLILTVNPGLQMLDLTGISSGAANEDDTLVITAVSSDTNLIPDPTVTYTSPEPVGTLTFTPVLDATGTATVTVTIDDGLTSVDQEFTVTIS
ncbi:MAG: tandem-95 repeat protein [Gemmataceae bacterium]